MLAKNLLSAGKFNFSNYFVMFFLCLRISAFAVSQSESPILKGNGFEISFPNTGNTFWQYKQTSFKKSLDFEGPTFEVNGEKLSCQLSDIRQIGLPQTLKNGVVEYQVSGNYKKIPGLSLIMTIQLPPDNPVIRFRYELTGNGAFRLTKTNASDNISYLSFSVPEKSKLKEVKLSEFNELYHSFNLSEREMGQSHFTAQTSFMGPILTGETGGNSFLVAYEHGSQAPDMFLQYSLSLPGKILLSGVKGNYYQGMTNFQSIWFEAAFTAGGEEQLARNYRSFVLNYITQNAESRKPYIFYNTWNYQERNKHWNKKAYLSEMNNARMLEEIETAHKMGIEVFVIDAGWFGKSGDWEPSKERFPNGLKAIKETLDRYGMKLGLWFNPTIAAASSKMLENNKQCMKTWNGKEEGPFPVWETENSYSMCLVSNYREAFANELIRLAKELGVRYFKWDAIAQYGCNSPLHLHGNTSNSPEECADCYAFEIGRSMNYVVNKLCEAVPDAIVDFDITEGERSVGLGFLSSGKYFLINNGPYYQNYNVPFDSKNENWNIFFYPGPARSWICRAPLTFDKWVPSVLFLTHYLPDDPYENQSISAASLILGQNGIWGDLLKISPEGVNFFNEVLGRYKQVRNDITKATMVRDGAVGGSPEVYEKVNIENGKGVVVLFSSHKGNYQYVTKQKVNPAFWATKGVEVTFGSDGNASIKANFENAEGKIIFFGVE